MYESPPVSYMKKSEVYSEKKESSTSKFIRENVPNGGRLYQSQSFPYSTQPISVGKKSFVYQGNQNKCSRSGCNNPRLYKSQFMFPYCSVNCSRENEIYFKSVQDKPKNICSNPGCTELRIMKEGVEFPYCSYTCSKAYEEKFIGLCTQ
jgi:hypothetical protein